jgi:hypothetical protein
MGAVLGNLAAICMLGWEFMQRIKHGSMSAEISGDNILKEGVKHVKRYVVKIHMR